MANSSPNVITVLHSVADSIRSKLGYTKDVQPLKPISFADEIRNLPQQGEGGTYADPAELVEGTISTVTNNTSYIKPYTFAYCANLSYADFPECFSEGDTLEECFLQT